MGLLGAGILGTAIGIKFNKKIEETYAVAAILIILAIYFPALFFSFTPGIVISLVAIGISFIYILFKLFTDRMAIKKTLFTWGGLALFAYFCFFVYYAYHRDFNHPDEFYCWGLMAKGYYRYNELFSEFKTAISGEQPPLLPIWNFFNAKLWTGFSDSICYLAQDFLVVSMLTSVFAHIKCKMTAPKFCVIAGCLPLLLVLSGMEGFDYVLVDGAIAAALCFFVLNVLSYVRSGDRYYYVASVLSLLAITLTKRVGPIFVGLMIFIVSSVFIRQKKYIELVGYAFLSAIVSYSWFGIGFKKVHLAITMAIIPLAFLVGAAIFYFVIKMILKVPAKYREGVVVLCVFGMFAVLLLGTIKYMGTDGYAYGVLARFCDDFIDITVKDGYIKLSYGIFMIMAVGLAAYNHVHKKDAVIRDISFLTVFAMTAYALAMLYLHIFSIGPLNSYIEGLVPRYMIPWEIMVAFLYCYEFVVDNEKITFVKCLAVFMVIAVISNSSEFFRGLFYKHQAQEYKEFAKAGIELQAGDMIYFVDEEATYGYADREFFYNAFPARSNYIYTIFEGTLEELEIPADEFRKELLEQYNYLYLQTCTEGFIERYADLFGGEDKVLQGSAYYVVPDSGDGVILKKIEKQG